MPKVKYSSKILFLVLIIFVVLEYSMSKDIQQLKVIAQTGIWKSLMYPDFQTKEQSISLCSLQKSYCDLPQATEDLKSKIQSIKRKFLSSVDMAKSLTELVREKQVYTNNLLFKRSFIQEKKQMYSIFRKITLNNRLILIKMIKNRSTPLVNILEKFREARDQPKVIIQNLDQLLYPEFLVDIKIILMVSRQPKYRLSQIADLAKTLSSRTPYFKTNFDKCLRVQVMTLKNEVCTICDPSERIYNSVDNSIFKEVIERCLAYKKEMAGIISKFEVSSQRRRILRNRKLPIRRTEVSNNDYGKMNQNNIQRLFKLVFSDLKENFKGYNIYKLNAGDSKHCILNFDFDMDWKIEGNKATINICSNSMRDSDQYMNIEYQVLMDNFLESFKKYECIHTQAESSAYQVQTLNFHSWMSNSLTNQKQSGPVISEYFV